MIDGSDPIEPTAAELSAVRAALARAGESVWAELPVELEGRVVGAIAGPPDESTTIAPFGLPAAVPGRRPVGVRWWLAVAATMVVVVTGIVLLDRSGSDDGGVVFALEGTAAAPGSSAEVTISARPAGIQILLDHVGLPGAPDGTYYEAWLSDGRTRISAGTFHLRGGGGRIELWAGVIDPAFNQLAITLEPIDGDPDSSGNIQMRGSFSLGG